MFDAVTDLTGGFDPMLGRIQVLPLGAIVILQIVEGAVRLTFDRDILRKRFFIRGCDSRHEGEYGNHAHKECKEFCESLSHGFVCFPFLVLI